LLGPEEARRSTVDVWAEHVTAFSLAAIERLSQRTGAGEER